MHGDDKLKTMVAPERREADMFANISAYMGLQSCVYLWMCVCVAYFLKWVVNTWVFIIPFINNLLYIVNYYIIPFERQQKLMRTDISWALQV